MGHIRLQDVSFAYQPGQPVLRHLNLDIEAGQAIGKTAIIIAHRLSTIRHADKIVVVKDGQIVETGRHDSLLAENGAYAALWKVQVGAVEVE